MENKYYVPDITEFRVGFEVFVGELPSIITEESLKLILNYVTKDLTICNHGQSVFKLPIEPIRVKYLDKEDIESLFPNSEIFDEDSATGGYTQESLKSTEFYLEVHTEKTWYFIYKLNGKLYIEEDETYLFGGIVNNKSELQQVLKMIGVIG